MSRPRSLPPGANLSQLKNQAKDLKNACQQGDPQAIGRIRQTHPKFSGSTQGEIAARKIVLADAQLVIARELGFESWPKLRKHVESSSHPVPSMHELVIKNDLQAMQQAVAQDPESVNQLNDSGLPPLYTARLFRNREAIQLLSSMGQSWISSPAPTWTRRPTPSSCSSEIPTWHGQPPPTE